MKRILPAQAEERMQCAGVGVAFRACWQAKRAESSCSCALYSALCCHAFTAEQLPVLRRMRSHGWCNGVACMSEGGTPLSRQSAGLLACLLHHSAHAAASR